MNVVSQHQPELEALNLDGNKLDMVETLHILKLKLPKLKILHIGDNEIKDIKEIDAIRDLEELKLAGNPICNDYQTLIKCMQKRCPELLRLVGMDLRKPALSDAVDEGNMPASERMLAANAQAQHIASQFLEQYFLIFDSEKREPLLSAYTRDACFSITVFDRHRSSNPNMLNEYIMDDRKYNTQKQQKLLKQGRLQIVAYLSQMPRRSHDVNTFTMYVSLITEAMMLVKVSGMFKDLDKKEQPIRYINRTFTIIPEESGYCNRDEQLHVTQPTEAQLKQENWQPNVQTRGAEASTVIPEVQMLEPKYQMTYPEEQITDPQAQMTDSQTSTVSSTTEPSTAPILGDIRQ
ncbi:hypothetical protein QLX08_011060 [Tetragonisca angustula]|uniref:NTF2 domain-containing protein n=1 Tax=Tetragonisca angustula TaxID=166442 RepID=A0AAW0Z9Y2_9HYME